MSCVIHQCLHVCISGPPFLSIARSFVMKYSTNEKKKNRSSINIFISYSMIIDQYEFLVMEEIMNWDKRIIEIVLHKIRIIVVQLIVRWNIHFENDNRSTKFK
jgi:hypothetical protein